MSIPVLCSAPKWPRFSSSYRRIVVAAISTTIVVSRQAIWGISPERLAAHLMMMLMMSWRQWLIESILRRSSMINDDALRWHHHQQVALVHEMMSRRARNPARYLCNNVVIMQISM